MLLHDIINNNVKKTTSDIAIQLKCDVIEKWLDDNNKSRKEFTYYMDYFSKRGILSCAPTIADMIEKNYISEKDGINYMISLLY